MKTTYKILASICALYSSLALSNPANAANGLPELNLDVEQVTVSGLSSGGYMATQFHIAHSDWVKGAGIIAAGPYYCAQNDITTALNQCVNKVDTPINLDVLSSVAVDYASEGTIAPLTGLKDAKVWLFHGTHDVRVTEQASNLLYRQYQNWTDTQNIVYVNDQRAAHHFPTLDEGSNCSVSESPFIGNCNYDAAGNMLNHLLPNLTVPDDTISGKVYTISQQKLSGADGETLADKGFVFVPENCAEGEPCSLHISFHGCNQYAEAVGDSYVTKTGINRWADNNNIVVLYPQTKKSLFMPLNPQGCWDWWGYSSDDYANRKGSQISAVTNMIKNINTGAANKTMMNTGTANND
ncbi:PHB depolymerase family esterase [Alteromonas stellipolaris]|uniref:extracellular catalytic domain type 2 short-chain-length polyhydroxyalkanoate depolymerase n=1 Tax=Alteromonas stellipolaris TaxID=233316 RepID=UPI0026E35FD4|nr:PHB depolymerase family esterase [Alteromonas stellipolaris]MDO6539904.1 PHB depolymerase family esterase [Alteromonas stellipolaris]